MKIKVKEYYAEEHPVCYAIVFDTGYFYIGATTKFNTRVKQHMAAIKKTPEYYMIGVYHNPKSCEIIKLLLCHDVEKIFRHERELILLNAHNKKMINYSPKNSNIMLTSINSIKRSLKNQNL